MAEPRADGGRHTLVAFNTATASDNKIHDDGVARRLGFTGGLVPGVDVFAYLCHLPVARWGVAWLERGSISARFRRPVYDGDDVEIEMTEGVDDTFVEHVVTSTAGEAASAEVRGPADRVATAPEPALRAHPRTADHPAASPESLAAGTQLGTIEFGFHADKAGPYLADVRERHPIYQSEGIAHPGWLLRYANYVLAENVRLGPWIHTASTVQFFSTVPDGAALECRGLVRREYERNGHRLVDLDVELVSNGRLALRVDHTAIYRPRSSTDPTNGGDGDAEAGRSRRVAKEEE